MHIERKIEEMGLQLPTPAAAANYVMVNRVGDLLFTGQSPYVANIAHC